MGITIATWNLECFQHPTETPKSVRKKIYPKKLDYIEDILVHKLNLPDIIGFQEITGATEIEEYIEKGIGPQRQAPKSLLDLHERLKAHAPYEFVYSNYRSRGKRIAFFYKKPDIKLHKDEIEIFDQFGPESHISYPWVELDSHTNKLRVFEFGDPKSWHETRGQFILPPMCVRISIGEKNLHVFLAHLKSKVPRYDFENGYPNIEGTNRTRRHIPQDPCEEARGKMRSLLIRAREACQLRFLAYERLNKFPEDSVVLLGDLGDNTGSITTQILEDTEETSHYKLIDSIDSRLLLFNLSSLIKPQKKFSYIYNNVKEQHDHILIGKDLMPNITSLDTHDFNLSEETKILVWNEDIHKKSLVPEGYEYVPDHAPVLANLDIS